MVAPLLVVFAGGATGEWRVERISAFRGESLPLVERVAVTAVPNGQAPTPPTDAAWLLRGVTSHERYVGRAEHDALAARQPPLARAEASRAALIPIRKSEAWWTLAQDERQRIFEERSHHVRVGLEYLPAVARRLHHSRDLGEPFDFLTWFEYAPADARRFDDLVERLRATEEWSYVEREVDIRLVR